MNQVKFVEDNLQEIWNDMVCSAVPRVFFSIPVHVPGTGL